MAELIENQYLTFGIDHEMYAVPVSQVREVLEYIKPTKLPKAEAHLKGIINLRGNGIPVVDLRVKFGLSEIEVSRDTAIIVIEIHGGMDERMIIGALTDQVYEVIELDASQLEAAPRFGTRVAGEYIRNVGKKDEHFIIILDIDKVFDGNETQMTGVAVPAEA